MPCFITLIVRERTSRPDRILELASRYGATNVRVFGSRARGEVRPGSDVDVRVALKQGTTLLDVVALWQDLQDLLGTDVDLLTENGLSPYPRDAILAEATPL